MKTVATFAALFLAAAALAAEPAAPEAAPVVPAGGTTTAADAGKASPQAATDPDSSFQTFCADWMDILVQREEENATHIQWQEVENGVKGSYVGYSPQHTCVTKNGTDATPVGRITYREITYEKHGATVPEAEVSPARAVATIETTEIFRFGDGRWIY